MRAAVHGLLTLTAAARGRWERFDAHLRVCEALYPTLTSDHIREYAMAMADAAQHALDRRQPERALRVLALAELRSRSTAERERVAALRRKIEAVRSAPP
jgi:hypothetical protein